jgi:hypothetical protein
MDLSLTNPGLSYDQDGVDPTTGMQLPPIIKYFKNAVLRDQRLADDTKKAQKFTGDSANATANAPLTIAPTHVLSVQGDPNATDASGAPQMPQLSVGTDGGPQLGKAAPVTDAPILPKMFKPSFAQTATTPQGLPAPANPAQSKLGKLVTILAAAGRGALAGWGTGNPAAGAEAARDIPFQQAQQRQQLAQGQAQLALTRSQSSMVQTPMGLLPFGMAKAIYPKLIGAQATVDAANIGAGAKTGAAQIEAGGRVQAAQVSKRFMSVPNVGLFDTQTPDANGRPSLIPGTSQGVTITPEIANDYSLPPDFIGKPLKLSDLNGLESNAAKFAPTVGTSTDALGVTTSHTSQKLRPGATPGRATATAPGGPVPVGTISASASGAVPAGTAGTGARKPVTAGGGGNSVLQSTAQGLVEGTMDPSQLPKKSNDYLAVLHAADNYSQQKYGKPFDLAQTQTDYKFANEPATQNTLKYLNSLTGSKGGKGNLDALVSLSNNIDRTEFPSINDAEAWAKIQSGDPKMAAYRTAVTEVADQVAKILQGGGSGGGTSDAKLHQAAGLFATGFTKGQITEVASTLRDLLANRKTELIGDNRYLQKQFGAPKAAPQAVIPGATHVFVPGKGLTAAPSAVPAPTVQ